MKTLKFVMYLFYRYYNKGGTKRIPYFSALSAVVFLIYIHIFQLLIILNKVNLLPMQKYDLRIEKYGKLALFLLPIFLIVAFIVKPSELKKLQYNDEKKRKGEVSLIIYITANIILLFVFMFSFSKG